MEGTEYNSTAVLHIQGDQGTEIVNRINIAASNGQAQAIDIHNIGSADQPRPSSDLLENNGTKPLIINHSLSFFTILFVKN